jgi:hypothetical protein
MMHRLTLVLLMLIVGAPCARAQTGEPQGTVLPSRRHHGFMAQVGLGVAGCTGPDCAIVAPGPSLTLDALYRFHRFGALGVKLAFAILDPDERSGDRRFWTVDLGLEARAILPVKRFDLWAGLSLGYARHLVDGVSGGYSDGFALGFGAGIDLFVLSRLAVGLAFRGLRPWMTRSCSTLRDPDGSTISLCELAASNPLGVVWSVVVSTTLYYGPDRK